MAAGQPGIPNNLYLQTANRQNYLTWGQTTGATSYNILRSLDNVTFTTLATLSGTPLYTNYLDTSVTIGTQYWYGVTASNTFGTSGVATPNQNSIQSLVPAPTSEMALFTLRRRVREKADRVNSNFVTDPELNAFISLANYELYDLLIDTYQNYNVATPVQFPTNGTQYLFPLPDGFIPFTNRITNTVFVAPPFYRLLGMDLSLNTANNAYVTMGKFPFTERNDYVYPNAAGTIYGVYNMRYQLVGSNLMIIPTPTANQILSIWYIPRLPELMQNTDMTTLGISGWLDYVITRSAKYCLDKEESDTTKLETEIAYLKGRIEESAIDRDAGIPNTISRVRGFNGINGRDGDSWGGTPSAGWLVASFNVLPHLPQTNSTHQLLADSIHFSQMSFSMCLFGIMLSYLFYLVLRQNSCTISFSDMFSFIGRCLTAFRNHIVNIIFHRSEKQMTRIDTFPVVAFMANHEMLRNSAKMNFPTDPMNSSLLSSESFSIRSGFKFIDNRHHSIPRIIKRSSPLPTSTNGSFFNFTPKSFYNWFRGIIHK